MPQGNNTNTNSALQIFKGLVRNNRFRVELPKTGFGFAAETVEFPSLAIGTADYQYNSQPILKIPYGKLPAQTCNITFRLDDSGEPTKSLYNIINKIVVNSGGDYFVEYANNLWETIEISALNVDDSDIMTLTLTRCILTNIDTVQFSFDDRDSYQKQAVTFSYQDAFIN